VCEFHHSAADEGVASGAVTALSFCTDPLLDPYLLSGCDSGSLAVWNLNSRSLQTLVPLAHEGPIIGLLCVPRSNAVITTGSRDNAMKQWAIDAVDGTPKVTRSKVGHSLPPSKLRHFRSSESIGTVLGGADAMTCEVVSVGTDASLRMFHTALDRQNRELSQGEATVCVRCVAE
jgi:U3 small nucleolar RNA-associated protein 21